MLSTVLSATHTELLKLAPLIQHTARSFTRRAPFAVDSRDLEQDAWLACLAAQQRHRSERSGLKTYVRQRVRGAMIDGLRRWDNRRGHRRIVWEPLPDNLERCGVIDTRVLETLIEAETQGQLHAALAELPLDEAYVLVREYFDGAPPAVIAGELRRSKGWVQQLRRAGLDRLKIALQPL